MEIDHPDRVPELVARAFAVAQTGRPGPVVVALPEDMLTAATDAVAGPAVRIPLAAPAAEDLAEIARLLEGAGAPLVLAGGGGWGAAGRAGLRAFAESNRLPVVVGFRDQDLLTSASPSYAGDGGLAKTPGVRRLLTRGGRAPRRRPPLRRDPDRGLHASSASRRMAATLIHAHAADGELNKIAHRRAAGARPSRPADAGAGRAPPRRRRGRWAARTAAAHADWRASLATPPQPGALDMGEVVRHLQERLPADAILTNGAGNFATWTNKHFAFSRGPAPPRAAVGRHGLRRCPPPSPRRSPTRSARWSASPATATSR